MKAKEIISAAWITIFMASIGQISTIHNELYRIIVICVLAICSIILYGRIVKGRATGNGA